MRPRRYLGAPKRALDLLVLLGAHAALAPLFFILWIAIPLAIVLEDGRPVFHTQDRFGKDGRRFKLYKFRSMRVRRASEPWPEDTQEGDSRVTRVGRFLRKTALDELPQVINIARGDISFVGPRALPIQMHLEDTQQEPRFPLRLQARPGLTGLAQVYLPRQCHPRRRLGYDLLYIRKASLGLDLRLIFLSGW
jgi:lipopolysaccharide/colanic/teichoic acid biosynthesis glycosyltransferase